MAQPSKAAKMLDNLADLALRRKPRWGINWLDEYDYSVPQPTPASPNQRTVANGLQLILNFDAGRTTLVDKSLDWWVWLVKQPFMQNESMTSEPVYRPMHCYPHLFAYGIAMQRGHVEAAKAAAELLRSHFFWLLLGRIPVPGREVLDHHKGEKDGCTLIGRGNPKFSLPYVAAAGDRVWVREKKHTNSKFMFTRNTAVSTIVALGLNDPRVKIPKSEQNAIDIVAGFETRFNLPRFALHPAALNTARLFAADPSNAGIAQQIGQYLLACANDYQIDRYESVDVATVMNETNPSSTDHRMADIGYTNGEIQQASCSDGIRSTKETQVVIEETNSYLVRRTDGKEQRLTKPRGKKVYSFRCRNKVVVFERYDHLTTPPPLPPTPPEQIPAPVKPKPRRRCIFR